MYFPAWSAFSARPHPCIYFYSRIKMNPLSLGTFILSFGDRPNPSWKPLMSGAVSLALSASMPSFSQSICSFISLSFFAQLAMAIITLPSFTKMLLSPRSPWEKTSSSSGFSVFKNHTARAILNGVSSSSFRNPHRPDRYSVSNPIRLSGCLSYSYRDNPICRWSERA